MIEIIILIIVFLAAALAADYWKRLQLKRLQKELEETRRLLEQINDCSKGLSQIVGDE